MSAYWKSSSDLDGSSRREHEKDGLELVRFRFVPAAEDTLLDIYETNARGADHIEFGKAADWSDRELGLDFNVERKAWPAYRQFVEQERRSRIPHGAMFDFAAVVRDAVVAIASSGLTASVLTLMKTWVEARNGRKLRIKVGDIEVEVTQMAEKDVLRIFDLLQEKPTATGFELLLEMDSKKQEGSGSGFHKSPDP